MGQGYSENGSRVVPAVILQVGIKWVRFKVRMSSNQNNLWKSFQCTIKSRTQYLHIMMETDIVLLTSPTQPVVSLALEQMAMSVLEHQMKYCFLFRSHGICKNMHL